MIKLEEKYFNLVKEILLKILKVTNIKIGDFSSRAQR